MNIRVLQIGADRSRRGILVPGSPAYARQKAYAEIFGHLDTVAFSLESDGFHEIRDGSLRILPTNSVTKYLHILSALRVAHALERPDVVSAQDPFEAGIAAFLVSRCFRVPLHIQVHTDFLSSGYSRMSLLNKARVFIAGFVLRRAARVRVVSERIKDSIQHAYALPVPITVLPIYADVQKVRDAVPPAHLVEKTRVFSEKVLFVGRLEPEKHPCLALRAFAEAAPDSACLIIVGAGSESSYLEQLARELGVADRVFFEGQQESAPYYALADLLLVTSRYEGYGLVIIEALAAGTPVLSTDVGVAREAGAIVVNEKEYTAALTRWFKQGSRTASLASYPYDTLSSYVQSYCDDVASAAV